MFLAALKNGEMSRRNKTMKTKYLFRLTAAVALLTVFACSKEFEPEFVPVETSRETGEGKTYTLTVHAQKGSAETRALILDDNTHTLAAQWNAGDKVDVCDQDGNIIGELEAQGDGVSTTLKGTITADVQDGDRLTLKFLSPDYANQGGTLAYIAANCDYATAEVEVSLPAEGNAITIGDASFVSQQAIVRFTLKNGHTNGAFGQANSLVFETGGERITVTPGTPDDILFVAIPAVSDADVRLEATAKSNSFLWGYHKASTTFEKGRYYEVGVKMKVILHVKTEEQLRACLDNQQLSEYTLLLDNDIRLQQLLTVPVQFAVNIDFCGHYLEGAQASGESVLTVNDGVRLTLMGPGGIRNGSAYNGGAIYNSGTLTLNEVTLSNNTASNQGGAIYSSGGTITMSGGSISGNTARNSGGIFLSGSTLNLTGGAISGNTATGNCGGVSASDNSTVTMSGGSIENNTANNRGGVYIGNGSTFTMTGGSVSGNIATNICGGIFVNGTLKMSGDAQVNDNEASGTVSNVFLNTGKTITVTGPFTTGANIGVTVADGEGLVTSGYSTFNGNTDPATYFIADDSSRRMLFGSEVELTYWYKTTKDISYASLQALLEKTGYNEQLENYYDLLGWIFSDIDKPTKAISYTYRSTDPDGIGVDLSAVIYVPLQRTDPLKGICLANHGTIASKDQCPTVSLTKGIAQFEGGFAWKNYVIVMPDYYGFGVSADRPQGYLDAENTARNTTDAYLVACKMLEDKAAEWNLDFQQNPKLYSFGYSQGGFNSMANLKYVTDHPELGIHFDSVICGGSPFDVEGTWNEYVAGTFHNSLAFVPMTVVSMNETQHLGLAYSSLFKGSLLGNWEEWVLSKKYTTGEISDKIKAAYGNDATMASIMNDTFMQRTGTAYNSILSVCRRYSLTSPDSATDWTPDSNTRIVLYHSTEDDTVPFSNLGIMAAMLSRVGHSNLRTIDGADGDHIDAVPQFILQLTVFGDEW